MRYIRSPAHFRQAAVVEEKEKSFRSRGSNCDILFPIKWKVVSTRAGRMVPVAGQIMGNPPGLSRSIFGIPIAKQGVAD
jgi:hypothetical protein